MPAHPRRTPPPPHAPPGYPFPCNDPLVGREVLVRECVPLAPSKSGKPRQACEIRRQTVVACAAPSADRPKRPQLAIVPSGQRFIVPTREVARDLRAAERHRTRSTKGNGAAGAHPRPVQAFDDLSRACVREMGGRYFLLRDRAKGWSSMGFAFDSEGEILRKFPGLEIGRPARDATGTYRPIHTMRSTLPDGTRATKSNDSGAGARASTSSALVRINSVGQTYGAPLAHLHDPYDAVAWEREALRVLRAMHPRTAFAEATREVCSAEAYRFQPAIGRIESDALRDLLGYEGVEFVASPGRSFVQFDGRPYYLGTPAELAANVVERAADMKRGEPRRVKANGHRPTKGNPLVECSRPTDEFNRYIGARFFYEGRHYTIEGCDANSASATEGSWRCMADGAKRVRLIPKRIVRDIAFQRRPAVELPDGRKGAKRRRAKRGSRA